MTIFRTIADFFIEALTPDWLKRRLASATPLSDNQRWTLAATAQLTELNQHSHDTLNPAPTKDSSQWAVDLNAWWEASDKAETIETLDWLQAPGNREEYWQVLGHEVLAWDLVRLINVARWGYGARHLHEDEAWSYMLAAAARLRSHYPSWEALADDYNLGHDHWAGQADPRFQEVTRRLLDPRNTRSPWNRVPWTAFRDIN
jgi:Protein of unknown function (DUF1266)